MEQRTLSFCKFIKHNESLLEAILDNSVGFEADQEKIFERFGQVKSELKDKPKGTGLGLAICKEIVEHYGGRIWVKINWAEGVTSHFLCHMSKV